VPTCLQGWCLLAQLPVGSPWQWHHVLGLGLWAAGWLANMHCDDTLRKLRTPDTDSGGWTPAGCLLAALLAAAAA
jgi:hypothetical protein